MNFYLSLFVFIISVVTGLVLMIAAKGMSRERFMLTASIHAIFLFSFIASLLLRKDTVNSVNYFFLAFVCSGVMLSGLSWRSESPMILKIYFSFFALTFPLFLFSPSMLLNFLLTMNYSGSNEPLMHLAGSYYLEKQSVSRVKDDIPHYKLISKHGLFHKTIQRDLSFGGKVDSIKIIEYNYGTSFTIRGYTNKSTYVSTETDSSDLVIPIGEKKQGGIEYRL